jgi:putative DNA primase/helicase
MVQPEALRGFIERAGALPRGTGFLARFLIAWPESTQGQRSYRPAPVAMPAVERFNVRIRALLDTPLTTDALGGLAPTVLDLSASAHAAWAQAHDTIEHELASGGSYAPIRDVAAKAAENIARLAALFHLLNHDATGTVGRACVDRATRIVVWHLQEAHRTVGRPRCPARAGGGHPIRYLIAQRSIAHRRRPDTDHARVPVRTWLRARQQGPERRTRAAGRTRGGRARRKRGAGASWW